MKLLPCPFCSNEPSHIHNVGGRSVARCRNCLFELPVDGWQDRATSPEEKPIKYIQHFDAWTLYCEAWRECFPNTKEQPTLSVAALAVFADLLQARFSPLGPTK